MAELLYWIRTDCTGVFNVWLISVFTCIILGMQVPFACETEICGIVRCQFWILFLFFFVLFLNP